MTNSVDRISSLPDDIREHILKFLPLGDAAKSTILSTKWRNIWTHLPTLVIDDSYHEMVSRGSKKIFFPGKRRSQNFKEREVVEKFMMLELCRVLMLRRGPLKEFSITLPKLKSQIEQLLPLLPYNTVESLTIKPGAYFCLSKSIFSSFSQLRTLRLRFCTFRFSPYPFVLDRLTVLELRDVLFPPSVDQLQIRCPLLTTLTLGKFGDEFGRPSLILVEETPKLSCFQYFGVGVSIQFEYIPLLRRIIIHKPYYGWKLEEKLKSSIDFLKVDGVLAAVESLSVSGCFYDCVPTEEPRHVQGNRKPWEKLKHLMLENVALNDQKHAWSVLGMITSSPNLEQLIIMLGTPKNCDKWPVFDYKDSDDNEAIETMKSGFGAEPSWLLRRVEVKRVRGMETDMALISWLLKSTPQLEIMEIQLAANLTDGRKVSVMAAVNEYQRASSRAQVRILTVL